jgi:hypothetical protein
VTGEGPELVFRLGGGARGTAGILDIAKFRCLPIIRYGDFILLSILLLSLTFTVSLTNLTLNLEGYWSKSIAGISP